MYQLIAQNKDVSLFINFEDPRLAGFELDDFRRLDAIIERDKFTHLFFDEIQMLSNWEWYVRQKLDEGFQVVVTGSNANLLSKELGTKLTGRHLSSELFPFSYNEFLTFSKLESNTESALKYMQVGGFPEFLKTNNPLVLHHLWDDILYRDIAVRYGVRDVQTLRKLAIYLLSNIGKTYSANKLSTLFQFKSVSTLLEYISHLENAYLQSVYDTVVIKDIAQRYKLRNLHNLHRIISFVFDSVGSYISPTNIAAELSKKSTKVISHNTIIKYLEFLTNSYIIYPASRYDIKGKELLTTNQKYYVVDLGLKNITTTNKFDADLGHKLENVVYFELLRRGGKIYAGKNNNKEIDFVVQKSNNERAYYQVAFTVNDEKTFEREISAFRSIRDNYPKYLLTLDFDNTSIDGVQKINVIDWLLQTV
jgi:predicted AAA+ superfamily ATPase